MQRGKSEINALLVDPAGEAVVRRGLQRAYAVNVLASDTVPFGVSAVGSPLGKITAIRVQDIARQLWFNWDDPRRTFDVAPSCTPGAGKLYVAAYAVNQSVAGNLVLSLVEWDTGKVLATKTLSVSYGGGVGIEWTGDMPYQPYNLKIVVTP